MKILLNLHCEATFMIELHSLFTAPHDFMLDHQISRWNEHITVIVKVSLISRVVEISTLLQNLLFY
jgi:hypothetical protein